MEMEMETRLHLHRKQSTSAPEEIYRETLTLEGVSVEVGARATVLKRVEALHCPPQNAVCAP